MSLSNATSKAPEVMYGPQYYGTITRLVRYCRSHSVPEPCTLTAKSLYNKVYNFESMKTFGTPAIVAACIFVACEFSKALKLKPLCDELRAPIKNTIEAIWLVSHSYVGIKADKIPALEVTVESSSWDNVDTYPIVGGAGVQEPKIIKLSSPGCKTWTLSGDYDSACGGLRTLAYYQRSLMEVERYQASLKESKKTITLVEEVPATKEMRPASKAQQDKMNSTKLLELLNSRVIASASAANIATRKSSKVTPKTIPTLSTKPVEKIKKVEPGINTTEEEADWDVIDATDHDDILKKWVKLDGQKLGTGKNGRRSWTSGLKKFFG